MSATRLLCVLLALTAFGEAGTLPTVLSDLIPNPSQSPQPFERQGASVAIDGNLVAVGAPSADIHDNNNGVVKVYDLSRDRADVPVLTIGNPVPHESSETFGSVLALSGTRLVIAAPRGSNKSAFGGVVYIFDLTADDPTTPIHSLWHPQPFERDGFGASVCLHDDLLIVGATTGWTDANQFPSAFLYDLTSDAPLSSFQRLQSGERHGAFGAAVAATEDFVAVGAPGEKHGRVYLWDRENLEAEPRFMVPNNSTSRRFGHALAVTGNRLAIGGINQIEVRDIANLNSTAVATILNGLGFQPYLALFGNYLTSSTVTRTSSPSHAVVYDLGADDPNVPIAKLESGVRDVALTASRLVVGVPLDTAMESGHATVYNLNEGDPKELLQLSTPTRSRTTRFGAAVAIDGDTIAIGAPQDSTRGLYTGAVYLYQRGEKDPYLTLYDPDPTQSHNQRFGSALSLSDHLLAVHSGNRVIHLYDVSPEANGSLINTVEGRQAFAISKGYLAVGQPDLRRAGESFPQGQVALYRIVPSQDPLEPVLTIDNPSPDTIRGFGGSLSFSFPRLLVGQNSARFSSSQAFLFHLAPGHPNQLTAKAQPPFSYPGTTRFSRFGEGVVIDGDYVAIAAPGERRVFVFQGSGDLYRLHHVFYDRNFSSITQLALEGRILANVDRKSTIGISQLTSSTPIVLEKVPLNTAPRWHQPAIALSQDVLLVGQGATGTPHSDDAVRVFECRSQSPGVALFTNEEHPETVAPGSEIVFEIVGPITHQRKEIIVENVGSEPLELEVSVTGFGYDAVVSESVRPGQRGSIRLAFDGQEIGAPGILILRTNSPAHPEIRFSLNSRHHPTDRDRDRDGLSDAAEFIFASLGFDPRVSQRRMVISFLDDANNAGLFTERQLQALQVNAPLISRDPESGRFEILLGLTQSSDLATFSPLALTEDQVRLTPDGNLLISLESESRTAFFRFECSR